MRRFNNAIVSPQGNDASDYHRLMKRKLAKYREDQYWNERLVRAKRFISSGKTMFEVQDELGLSNDEQYWQVIKYALALTYYDKSNTMIEWSVKAQIRYKMLIDVYERAKTEKKRKLVSIDDGTGRRKKKKVFREVEEPNLKIMLEALKQMNELDKTDIQLKSMMGLIAPVHDPVTGGQGYLTDGQRAAKQNEPIIAKLRGLISTVEQSVRDVAPHLLDVSEPGRETDNMGPTILDADNLSRPVEGNQDS